MTRSVFGIRRRSSSPGSTRWSRDSILPLSKGSVPENPSVTASWPVTIQQRDKSLQKIGSTSRIALSFGNSMSPVGATVARLMSTSARAFK